MTKVTLTDIAKRADVSTATVSRVFSGSPGVSPDLRSRVLETAKEMKFYRAPKEPGLTSPRIARSIGLLLALASDSLESDWFFAALIRGMGNFLREHSVNLVVDAFPTTQTAQIVQRFVDSRDVDGVVIGGLLGTPEPLMHLKQAEIPTATFERYLEGQVPSILIDNAVAFPEIVRHLAGHGHTTIGMVTGPENIPSANEKVEGFVRGLRELGLSDDPGYIVRDEHFHTWQGGRRAALSLLGRKPRPTAIVAADDIMAFGVLKAAEELGLSVPGDCAVVGFGDVLFKQTGIRISSVSVNYEYVGQVAAKVLTDRIAGLVDDDLTISVRPRFVIRETCGGAL